jgi:zinc protease
MKSQSNTRMISKMKKIFPFLGAFLSVRVCASLASGAAFLSVFSHSSQALAQEVAAVQEQKLSNGAPLDVAFNPRSPRVTLVVAFTGGASTIPMEKQGVTQILFDVLSEGPQGMSQEKYKETLFFANGSLSFSTSVRTSYLVIKAPPENLSDMFTLARRVLEKPKLDEKIFRLSKEKALTERRAGNDAMDYVIGYYSTRDLFSYHPETLTEDGSPWSISNVMLADARQTLAQLFNWDKAFYVATGPLDAAKLAAQVEKNLWPASKPKRYEMAKFAPPAVFPKADAQKATLPPAVVIHKDNATDNQVRFYFPLQLKLDTPEALSGELAHEILGGGLTGDLGRTLRVERGLTYHASSFIGSRLPVWGVASFAGMFQTQDLLTGIVEVVDKFQKRVIKPEEITIAKESLQTEFLGATELPQDRLFERIRYRLYGLDETFLENRSTLLASLTDADVKRFVDEKVKKENGRVYLMGDKSKILPVLEKIGMPVLKTVEIDGMK